jgi:hypothetical protein
VFLIFCEIIFGSIDKPINECIVDLFININAFAIKAAIFNLPSCCDFFKYLHIAFHNLVFLSTNSSSNIH